MAPGFSQTPEEQCIYYRSVISRRDEKIHTLEARTEELERALDARQRQIDAIQSAYHGLVSPGEEFYSWQRDWQNAARALLDLGPDATVEDINLALLLRYKEADRG